MFPLYLLYHITYVTEKAYMVEQMKMINSDDLKEEKEKKYMKDLQTSLCKSFKLGRKDESFQ